MEPATSDVQGSRAGKVAFGAFVFFVGTGLLTAPWWSQTLPASDYPLTTVLGLLFAGGGLTLAIPARWGSLRTLAFTTMSGAFGAICAALALLPAHPDADGRLSIGGVPGFYAGPIPWWARVVAGTFALIFLATFAVGLWGLVRQLFQNSSSGRR